MFYGEYDHSVDEKGRLIIPAKIRSPFRDVLIDQFVLNRGFEGCLVLYPPNEWHEIEQKYRNYSTNKADVRNYLRMFFAGATVVECDKQGRIIIPKKLLEYAGIEKEVTLIGVSSKVELWAKEKWSQQYSKTIGSFSEIAEKIGDFDLKGNL